MSSRKDTHSSPRSSLAEELPRAIAALRRYVEGKRFGGYDPYDALLSPLLRTMTARSMWSRIAATQALRRLPLNARPLLGIAPAANAKAAGLFVASYVRLSAAAGSDDTEPALSDVSRKLLDLASAGYSGACWGYNFPWQSRAFYLPAGTPTVVNTAFCAHGLLDAYECTREENLLVTARSACDFVLRDLNRTETAHGTCFSYTPIDHTAVHNANALGASLLARVAAITGESELKETALASARHLLAHQKADGSWYYADTNFQSWIDSFHTGFVLDSLHTVIESLGFDEGREPLERGFRFFLDNFFEPDGSVRYYHNSLHPLDIHCPTQALVTLCRLWKVSPQPDLIRTVLAHLLDKWRAPEGYFYFRISRRGRPNRIPYMRWGQAWAMYAMAHVIDLERQHAFLDN